MIVGVTSKFNHLKLISNIIINAIFSTEIILDLCLFR